MHATTLVVRLRQRLRITNNQIGSVIRLNIGLPRVFHAGFSLDIARDTKIIGSCVIAKIKPEEFKVNLA